VGTAGSIKCWPGGSSRSSSYELSLSVLSYFFQFSSRLAHLFPTLFHSVQNILLQHMIITDSTYDIHAIRIAKGALSIPLFSLHLPFRCFSVPLFCFRLLFRAYLCISFVQNNGKSQNVTGVKLSKSLVGSRGRCTSHSILKNAS